MISLMRENACLITISPRICLKQGVPAEHLQSHLAQLIPPVDVPDKFELTAKQLVQIAIRENVSIAQRTYLPAHHG